MDPSARSEDLQRVIGGRVIPAGSRSFLWRWQEEGPMTAAGFGRATGGLMKETSWKDEIVKIETEGTSWGRDSPVDGGRGYEEEVRLCIFDPLPFGAGKGSEIITLLTAVLGVCFPGTIASKEHSRDSTLNSKNRIMKAAWCIFAADMHCVRKIQGGSRIVSAASEKPYARRRSEYDRSLLWNSSYLLAVHRAEDKAVVMQISVRIPVTEVKAGYRGKSAARSVD
ncbi:hypothetical protein C8R44DRAFT_739008 [Mycena epipterygia]|nr:hypothetical protein C8R44DRAFT_739008 [Mycena epipterygia]